MMLVRLLMQTVGLALAQIRTNKFRAALTALGIIIGVASVTSVIAALDGMKKGILSEVESFGARKLWVWGEVPRELRGKMDWKDVAMTDEEFDAIRANCPSITRLTALLNSSYTISYGEVKKDAVQITGIQPDWHEIESRHVIVGRQLTTDDDAERKQVCLINEKAIEELRLPTDPVGEHIMVKDRRFLIVGVLETKEVSAMFGGGETMSEVYVAYSVCRKLNPLFAFPYAMAQLSAPDKADDAKAEIRFVLRKARGLAPEKSDTFGMEILQQAIDQFNSLAAGITSIAGGVVSISLLVGGIGIMNIMLVSVSERTREIGLRKSVGAKPLTVLMQFLVEAITLCLMGGLIGLVAGQGLTLMLQQMKGANLEQAAIPGWAIFLSLGFSAGVGVIFGMLPAIKAARLDPIEALRHA